MVSTLRKLVFDIETIGENFDALDKVTQDSLTRWLEREAYDKEEYTRLLQDIKDGLGFSPLTGEVVDVTCYLTHPESGIGPKHADCARKCIEGGLPVAIKVGGQLYLAVGGDHQPANKTLAAHAGRQVTVTGNVTERDGQHLITISNVKPLD